MLEAATPSEPGYKELPVLLVKDPVEGIKCGHCTSEIGGIQHCFH
jgi:hypothetical protein